MNLFSFGAAHRDGVDGSRLRLRKLGAASGSRFLPQAPSDSANCKTVQQAIAQTVRVAVGRSGRSRCSPTEARSSQQTKRTRSSSTESDVRFSASRITGITQMRAHAYRQIRTPNAAPRVRGAGHGELTDRNSRILKNRYLTTPGRSNRRPRCSAGLPRSRACVSSRGELSGFTAFGGVSKNRAARGQIVDHAGVAVGPEGLSWTTPPRLRRGGYQAHEPVLRRVSTVVVPESWDGSLSILRSR